MTEQVIPRPGIADRLSQLIRIPTVSAELDERGMQPFDELIALLHDLYPLVHEHLELTRHTDLGLLLRRRGRPGAGGPLVLMAHFDVVPVDESDPWTHPPFDGHVDGEWVYGRGTLDDKGPLIVILEAVENLLAAGFTPARDVCLSFGGNEETYGAAAREIAASFQSRGEIPWLVLDVGGAIASCVFGIALLQGVTHAGGADSTAGSFAGYVTVWVVCGATALVAAVLLLVVPKTAFSDQHTGHADTRDAEPIV